MTFGLAGLLGMGNTAFTISREEAEWRRLRDGAPVQNAGNAVYLTTSEQILAQSWQNEQIAAAASAPQASGRMQHETDGELLERQKKLSAVPLEKPVPALLKYKKPADLDAYVEVAEAVGVAPPNLVVEEFKAFLAKKDWPVYSLDRVIAYMDKKAEAESLQQSGWRWLPLRGRDRLKEGFGKEGFRKYNERMDLTVQVASDLYAPGAPVYDKLVPLHALKKVMEIEQEFKRPVFFMVCDYAPAPHVEWPDPFLMAIINNPRVAGGEGRFVIDFWDEPWFGLEDQLSE